jgi:hypothetical protein
VNFKGWLLLAVFLLLQVGSVAASVCSSGPVPVAVGEVACSAAGCCCCLEDGQTACPCAQAPAEDRTPAPLAPLSTAGRDVLPLPMWFENRAGMWPERERRDGFPARLGRRPAAPEPSVVVAPLTIRYCALVI